MKIKIKRFDKTLPLPEYKTAGSACLDLYVRETTVIEPHGIGYIPLNVAIEIPKGHLIMLYPRSSAHKAGIICANSVGIGDSDFCGDSDEYKFIAYNIKSESVTIEKGTRIAQMMVVAYDRVEVEEVDHLGNPNRGGIGSTGTR